MTTAFLLQPPIPTSTLDFAAVFISPDYSELVDLSKARSAFQEAMIQLVVTKDKDNKDIPKDAVATAELYVGKWKTFWKRKILDAGAVVTHAPFATAWRINIFGGDSSTEYADSSPLFECACAGLALVAAYQRMGCQTADMAPAVAKINATLSWLQESVVPFLRPRIGRDGAGPRKREPIVYSTLLYDCIRKAVEGQSEVKTAFVEVLASEKDSEKLVSAVGKMFVGARKFQYASELLPTEPAIQAMGKKSTSFAYRYMAQFLAAANGGEHGGLAVACAREAAKLNPIAPIVNFFAEIEKRNEQEWMFQREPAAIQIKFSQKIDKIDIAKAEEEDATIITVPLAPNAK